MSKLVRFWRPNFRRENGQAIVEYGLVIALIAVAAMVGLTAMGGDIDGLYGTFETLTSAMANALGG